MKRTMWLCSLLAGVALVTAARGDMIDVTYLYDHYAGGIDTNESAAALAASIWECVYESNDNPLSLSGGVYWIDNFRHDPIVQTIVELGNSMLASLSEMPIGYTSSADLWILRSTEHQDILVAGGRGPSVPEPLTMTLLTLGGTGLLVKSRRTLKKIATR